MKKGIDYIGVGCGALIVDGEKILLMKRTKKCSGGLAGFWSEPGGTIEFGETIQEAIEREVMEELNVGIELFGPIYYYDDIRKEDGILKHRVTGGCFANIVSGELRNMEPSKCEELKWFGINEIPENTASYTKESILQYKKYLKNI